MQTSQYRSLSIGPLPLAGSRRAYKLAGPLREELGDNHEFDFFDGEYEIGPAPGECGACETALDGSFAH